jgi:hypothetical protein
MDNTAASSPQPGSAGDAGMLHQLLAMQQQQMQQQQQLIASIVQGQQQLHAQQQRQAAPQTATAAQLLALSALGPLKAFAGHTDAAGLAAREWLAQAEYHFAARESALGVSAAQGDEFRVHSARASLTDDALRWLTAMPQPPVTWTSFRTAFLQRFSSVPAAQVREAQLQRFVDAARRVRDKLNTDGLQRYTTLFLQHAGEIPAERMTDASKRTLYAQGLPPRYAELVLTEDAKAQPPALHEVAQLVLAKATLKAHAASASTAAAASPASGRSDAMDVDAISMCAAQFGVPRDEAARYLAPGEGWAPHDTAGGSGAAAAAASPASSSSSGDDQLERLLNALAARFGSSLGSSSAKARGQSQRRNVPSGVLADIPEELVKARKAAGLCIKCGVAKYEGGSSGHNSRTCKAPADRSTSAEAGRKKADF